MITNYSGYNLAVANYNTQSGGGGLPPLPSSYQMPDPRVMNDYMAWRSSNPSVSASASPQCREPTFKCMSTCCALFVSGSFAVGGFTAINPDDPDPIAITLGVLGALTFIGTCICWCICCSGTKISQDSEA